MNQKSDTTVTPGAGSARSGGIAIAVSMMVMSACAYAFTVIASHALGPTEYGVLGSLMGLLLVLSVASLGLQTTGARRIASHPESRDAVTESVMRTSWIMGVALTAVMLAITPVLDRVLSLPSIWASVFLAGCALPLTLMGGQSGILQGDRRWTSLSWLYLFNGIGRIVPGLAALSFSHTSGGAMFGVFVGTWFPVAVGAFALRDRKRHSGAAVGGILTEIAHNSHALLAFFVLSNIDIVLARAELSGHQAGLYAAGLIIAKSVLFLPQFVVVVAFPNMSSTRGHRVLLGSLGIVLALGLLTTAGVAALHRIALLVVGGNEYADAEPILWLFAAMGTALALIQVLVYQVVARQHRHAVWVIWAGAVAIAVAALTVVHSARDLVVAAALIDVVVALITLIVALADRSAGSHPIEFPGQDAEETATD